MQDFVQLGVWDVSFHCYWLLVLLHVPRWFSQVSRSRCGFHMGHKL